MHEIIYPSVTTYFICYNSDKAEVTSHGIVEPNLQMQTGQSVLHTFTDKSEWLDALLVHRVNPNEYNL